LAIFRPRRMARWKNLLRHSGWLRTVTCAAGSSVHGDWDFFCAADHGQSAAGRSLVLGFLRHLRRI
jgi:hypothetical protein